MKQANPNLRKCSCGGGACVEYYPAFGTWMAHCVKCPSSTLHDKDKERATSTWNKAQEKLNGT